MRDHARRVVRVLQQARHVAHVNQALGLERDCRLASGDIGVAVVNLTILTGGRRADHRCDVLRDALEQRRSVHPGDFADQADVERLAGLAKRPKRFASKNFRAGKTARLAAEFVDHPDDAGVDLPRQNLLDDPDRLRRRHAMPLLEPRRHSGLLERPGDRLAAAVHDDRVDANRLDENNIPRHAAAHGRVGRVHETAAVLDDKRLPPKPLHVRQRFQKSGRFVNELIH